MYAYVCVSAIGPQTRVRDVVVIKPALARTFGEI